MRRKNEMVRVRGGSVYDRITASRKFGKHLLHPIRLFDLKTRAKKNAVVWRKKGYLARMVKVGGQHELWAVYIKKVEK
jgi:hypothetical protein